MTKREIASLSLKLIGVYCLVQCFPLLFLVASSASRNSGQGPMRPGLLTAMYLLPLAAMGFCILMIRMSDSIAHRLIAEDGEAKTGTAIDRDAVATIAFATVGLLLLCGGIQRLAGVCANYLIFYSAQQQGSVSMLHSGLVEAIVKFAVGLWLFLRADGLVGLWRTLRTAPSATS